MAKRRKKARKSRKKTTSGRCKVVNVTGAGRRKLCWGRKGIKSNTKA